MWSWRDEGEAVGRNGGVEEWRSGRDGRHPPLFHSSTLPFVRCRLALRPRPGASASCDLRAGGDDAGAVPLDGFYLAEAGTGSIQRAAGADSVAAALGELRGCMANRAVRALLPEHGGGGARGHRGEPDIEQ